MSEMFHELYPLAKGLDAAALRHRVIAANLANVNTPGYVRYDVEFEELLREKLGENAGASDFTQAMRNTMPKVVQDARGPFKPDGNNVTAERENGQITRNEILFNAYAEVMSLKLSQLKFVISSTK